MRNALPLLAAVLLVGTATAQTKLEKRVGPVQADDGGPVSYTHLTLPTNREV